MARQSLYGSAMSAENSLKILVVDDDPLISTAVKTALGEGFQVSAAQDGQEAMRSLNKEKIDLVLLDMNLPRLSGMELLRIFKQRFPSLAVIMLTGVSDTQTIIESMKAGANDYLIKGADDFQIKLNSSINQQLEKKLLLVKTERLEAKVAQAEEAYAMIGNSIPILKLKSQLSNIKGHKASVLILGKSGTGKEITARKLNIQEGRSRPFVDVNCAAIPEHLMESEFFGHEKGAFTNAIQKREGKFQAANGGDILLDEIGELPLSMQAKLLRVIQEGTVTPVGSNQSIPVDVRVIAATNRDLADEVRKGRFREDLYYRLNVIELQVPSLSDRLEDIPDLVQFFLKQLGAPQMRISEPAMEKLYSHKWPGNIRELRNAIERALILAKMSGRTQIQEEDFQFHPILTSMFEPVNVPQSFLTGDPNELSSDQYKDYLNWAERVYFENALKITRENKSQLAQRIGFSRESLRRKLKQLQIQSGLNDEMGFNL